MPPVFDKLVFSTIFVDLKSNIKSATGIIQFNRTDFGVEYRAEMHLDNAKSFWNKMNTTKETIKNKVIQDKIEIVRLNGTRAPEDHKNEICITRQLAILHHVLF